MKNIDLNCDMGELKAGQEQNFDEAIMPFISSCNIACGFHSGSPEMIERTIQLALHYGVKIGAHPSYDDHENFGRKSVKIDLEKLMAQLRYQICAVKGMAESLGAKLHHVKPHGALYNDMAEDEHLAKTFVKLVKSIDPQLKIFALAHSTFLRCCKEEEMAAVREGFADRRYQKINALRSRQLEGAVLHDPKMVLAQIENFLNERVQLHDGTICKINVESVCLHSDTEGAVALSQAIFNYLKSRNVNIAAVE